MLSEHFIQRDFQEAVSVKICLFVCLIELNICIHYVAKCTKRIARFDNDLVYDCMNNTTHLKEVLLMHTPSNEGGYIQAIRMIKPIEQLVPVSFTSYDASTPGLSTWSSSTALREYSFSGWFPA